jgi:hypothetical protein
VGRLDANVQARARQREAVVIRKTIVIPGYDCISKPCGRNGCGERPGANHGQHCDQWIFLVSDEAGDVVLSLRVSAGNFPRGPVRPPASHDITLHVGWPTNRDQVRDSSEACPCKWVTSGKCFCPYDSPSDAHQFEQHLDLKCSHDNQPESFWLALEERFTSLAKTYRALRADTQWKKCEHCDATGTVPR